MILHSSRHRHQHYWGNQSRGHARPTLAKCKSQHMHIPHDSTPEGQRNEHSDTIHHCKLQSPWTFTSSQSIMYIMCLLPGECLLQVGVSAPGGVCSQGMGMSAPRGCLLWGVSAFRGCLLQGGYLLPGVGGIPACTEADTPPWTESQTWVKTKPWPQLCGGQ